MEADASATWATTCGSFEEAAALGGGSVGGATTTLPFPFAPAEAGSVDNCSIPTTNVPTNIAGIDAAVSIWTGTGNSSSFSPPRPRCFCSFFTARHFWAVLLAFCFLIREREREIHAKRSEERKRDHSQSKLRSLNSSERVFALSSAIERTHACNPKTDRKRKGVKREKKKKRTPTSSFFFFFD
jgi:hypothetical protein